MPKRLDLIGQKFNRLTVIKFTGMRLGKSTFDCLCDCGNITNTFGDLLKRNKVKSCGCYLKDKNSQNYTKNLINKKFGRLLIIKKIGKLPDKSQKNIYWLGICDCGNTALVTSQCLNSNKTKSCGCLGDENRKCRTGSKHQNWNSNITEEHRKESRGYSMEGNPAYKKWSLEIKKIYNFTCFVCESKSKLESHHIKSWGQFPELRYVLDNGVCLCKQCHINFHKKYKFKNNSLEQIKEFKDAYISKHYIA